MRLSWNKPAGLLALLAALSMSGCQAQVVIQQADLRDWFISRLGWFSLASAVLGAVVARVLCRLPIKAPLLDCIGAARARFLTWLAALALFATPLLLWLDAWLTQPFGEDNQLGGVAVLSAAVLNWRTLGVMALVALVFFLSVALFTRYIFRHTCSCKYAFVPKFR
jgi:hypothetical protein